MKHLLIIIFISKAFLTSRLIITNEKVVKISCSKAAYTW